MTCGHSTRSELNRHGTARGVPVNHRAAAGDQAQDGPIAFSALSARPRPGTPLLVVICQEGELGSRGGGLAISMDGVGRAFDNIMVERLWRTVKYEDVYLRDYHTPAEARLGLGRFVGYYNHRRRHRSLGRRTPASVYGLAEPGSGGKHLVQPARRDRIETGGGCSLAARAAVAPVALRAPFATAAGTLPMATVPPYSRSETVQRMGTS